MSNEGMDWGFGTGRLSIVRNNTDKDGIETANDSLKKLKSKAVEMEAKAGKKHDRVKEGRTKVYDYYNKIVGSANELDQMIKGIYDAIDDGEDYTSLRRRLRGAESKSDWLDLDYDCLVSAGKDVKSDSDSAKNDAKECNTLESEAEEAMKNGKKAGARGGSLDSLKDQEGSVKEASDAVAKFAEEDGNIANEVDKKISEAKGIVDKAKKDIERAKKDIEDVKAMDDGPTGTVASGSSVKSTSSIKRKGSKSLDETILDIVNEYALRDARLQEALKVIEEETEAMKALEKEYNRLLDMKDGLRKIPSST